jgi:TonB-dependent SusC/RagA subfamily outer membrane receptor
MLYVIKLNLILALLCLLFQVLMHRDTFFGVRRAMLWGIYATAVLLPLWDMQLWLQDHTLAMHLTSDYATYVLPTLEITAMRVTSLGIEQSEPGCGMWFVGMMALWAIIYIIPVVWMTMKLLWQVAYIIYLRCTCKPIGMKNEESRFARNEEFKLSASPEGNSSFFTHHYSLFLFPRPCSPFSFGSWIFIHPEGMDEQTLREVLIHEQAHVRGWHTLDIIFSQLFCILFWWNPAVWVLRREVRLNLEFIADKAVADYLMEMKSEESRFARNEEFKLDDSNSYSSSFNLHSSLIKAYQYHLLGFSTQTNVATIANNFNVLPLKRRIIMMNLRRTHRTGMLKYILFVPVAAALLFLSNIDSLARNIKNMKPIAHIEQALTSPQTIAPVVEEVLPAAEEHIAVQTETTAEELVKPAPASDTAKAAPKTSQPTLERIDDNALWIIDQRIATPEEAAKLNLENNIESITVLKGEAATSLWGSRGANGVINITTKNAEKDNADSRVIYDKVDEMPEFPGGEEALYRFLIEHVKYPAIAQEIGAQGKVIVQFVVQADGQIADVQTDKVLSANGLTEIAIIRYKKDMTDEEIKAVDAQNNALESLKTEAVKMIKAMPRWKPGKKDGKPVDVRFSLPISFRLR